ncbi:MAG: carboxypeptidase-like regulatory domain-containing protein [Spirulinaceae cyanobacterium]
MIQERLNLTPDPSGPYTDADTEPGTGDVVGEVRWNNAGVEDIAVILCEGSLVGLPGLSCSGKSHLTRTDAQGQYLFEDMPVGSYTVAVQVFKSGRWVSWFDGSVTASTLVEEGKAVRFASVDIIKPLVTVPGDEELLDSNNPVLSWDEIPEASTYNLSFSLPGGGQPMGAQTSDAEYLLERQDNQCVYEWQVTAFNETGALIAQSEEQKFELDPC